MLSAQVKIPRKIYTIEQQQELAKTRIHRRQYLRKIKSLTGARSKIDLNRALALRIKGLNYDDIAQLLGVSRGCVIANLGSYMAEGLDLTIFKQNRADLLAGKQAQILKTLSEAEIRKASPYQRVGMFGILYDKERLERGQSTQNVSYAAMSRELEDLDREILELEAGLGSQNIVDNSDSNPVDNLST